MEPSRGTASARVELSPAAILRLHEHLLDLGATLNLPALYHEILQTCMILMCADKGHLQVLNPATGVRTIAAQIGFDSESLEKFAALDPSDAAGFRSVQSTPLYSSTGKLLAVVSTHWAEPHRPTEHQEAAVDAFLRQAAHFLERRVADDARDVAIARERSARRVAEDLNRGKDRFIATVVHELRQPLAPMLAAVELMKLPGSAQVEQRARQIIEKQLGQLVRLIEDLMDAARINEGKTRLQMTRVDIRNVVQDAIDAVDSVTRAKHQTVGLVAPDTEAWVDVDVARIQQVFGNLLLNASKFSPEDSHISVTIGFADADIRVDVEDHGRGISAGSLPHIFEVFRQTTEGESGGLGVGLSIVRGLVELHGGTVEARSGGLDCGSAFAVRLPRPH